MVFATLDMENAVYELCELLLNQYEIDFYHRIKCLAMFFEVYN